MKDKALSGHFLRNAVETITCMALAAVPLYASTLLAADQAEWTELRISPRKISEPLLAKRLFPDESQRRPGNAAVTLLRLFCNKNPIAWDMLVKNAPIYLAKSDDQFAPEDARKDVPLWFYEELRQAAYRKDADWQYPLDDSSPIGIADMMDTRVALRGLAVHCRVDIQEGEIDAALEKIAVGFGLCWHQKRAPFALVQITQAENIDMFLECVQKAIEHSGSPNLYWPLTAMPDPTECFRAVADWESRGALYRRNLRELDEERSRKEWRDIRDRLDLSETQPWPSVDELTIDGIKELFSGFAIEGRGRSYLRVATSSAERVDSMSADEVVVRYFVARYSALSDRMMCTLRLPPPEGLRMLRHTYALLREGDGPVFAREIPSIADIYLTVWSVRRRIQALRIVESVRHYAGRNDGQLPKTLDEMKQTPIPLDPMTGQAFEYNCEGDTAYVTGPPIRDEWRRSHKGHVIRLRLRVRH